MWLIRDRTFEKLSRKLPSKLNGAMPYWQFGSPDRQVQCKIIKIIIKISQEEYVFRYPQAEKKYTLIY